MALNNSGPISLGGSTTGQSINLELGFSATATISLNDAAVRGLAGVASGPITMPTDFYGKSNETRAVFAGSGNVLNYININSPGNASDFGDLLFAYDSGIAGGVASSTRGVFAGGENTGGTRQNIIQYITIDTTGNATDFGDLVTNGTAFISGASSSTRGVFFGGRTNSSTTINNIQYITIASTGNSTDFGDLLQSLRGTGAASSPTRAVVFGGFDGSDIDGVNVIQYVTIASAGNSTDFGDLSAKTWLCTACSNSTTAIVAGNFNAGGDSVSSITIASTGNASSFGTLTGRAFQYAALGAASSSSRAVYVGSSGGSNVMTYLEFASGGTDTDFGDLTANFKYGAGVSAGHGGL